MSKESTSVLKPSDFSDFEYSILLKNNTSGTEIHDSKHIKIIELMEKGMVLQVPNGACGSTQNLLLYLYPGKRGVKVHQLPDPNNDKLAIIITCKVIELESGKKAGYSAATVEFLQYTESKWRSFVKKFANIQGQIDKVFKVIKE